MANKNASSQVAWALLTEGVTKARIETHRLEHLINRAQKLVDTSEEKEHLYQVGGDIIAALPKRLEQLILALDRTSLALAKMGEEFLESRLPLSDRTMVDEAVESAFGKSTPKQSLKSRVVARYISDMGAPGLDHCAGYRTPDLSGYKTLVEDSHPQDKADGGRKDRLLPSPPWKREKPFGTPVINGPGESGSQPDGKSLSQDKPRTLGVPGESSPHPNNPATISPKRRQNMASGTGGSPFPLHRQKEQIGRAKKYHERYYRQNKSYIKRRSKRWYTKHKMNPILKRYKERVYDFPKRFERKPGGENSPADRTKEWRKENKEAVDRVVADFLYKKMPPDMEPGSWYDRGTPPIWQDDSDTRTPAHGDIDRGQVVPSGPGKTMPQDPSYANRQAALISEIKSLCGADLIQRSVKIPVKLHRVNTDKRVWLFNVKGSKGATYRVRVKALAKGNVKDPEKMDVLVSCSCPFWQWQGPEYWAQQNQYLYGKPRGSASQPNEKDPSMEHGACKHVLAVLDNFSTFVLPSKKVKLGSLMQVPEGDLARLDFVVSRYLIQSLRRI